MKTLYLVECYWQARQEGKYYAAAAFLKKIRSRRRP